jgi:hypothetical protein
MAAVGTSTGRVYSVSGTIGQPDAGKMSGGNYTLDGGFGALSPQCKRRAHRPLHRANHHETLSQFSGRRRLLVSRCNKITNSVSSVNWRTCSPRPLDDGSTKTVVVNSADGESVLSAV